MRAKNRNGFRFVLFLTVFTLVASLFAFSDDAEARRRRRRAKQPKVINEKKLFERIGGKSAIEKSVDDWIRRALADVTLSEKLKPFAEDPKGLAKSRKFLQDELCELADGPCEPADSQWAAIRSRAKLDEADSVTLTSHLSSALLAQGVGERERNELLGRLGQVEPYVVSEATGPASERRGGNR